MKCEDTGRRTVMRGGGWNGHGTDICSRTVEVVGVAAKTGLYWSARTAVKRERFKLGQRSESGEEGWKGGGCEEVNGEDAEVMGIVKMGKKGKPRSDGGEDGLKGECIGTVSKNRLEEMRAGYGK